jgi:hypothetical protein
MSYDNLSSVSQNVLKFYQQLTCEERRIPFIFEDFRFCRSRVIELDMTVPFPALSIRCPLVVYVKKPSHSFNIMLKAVRGAVNINY